MKKRMLALLLAVIMTVSVLSVTAGAAGKTSLFADVTTTDWFYDAVDYVNSNGLMTGTNRGFAPNDATTRAQIWAILARLGGENYDRNTTDWYAGYQTWAIRNSISDGSDPNGKITREQLAAMFYRYAIRMGFVSSGLWADLTVFPDCASVSTYACEAMQWAVGSGLIQGMSGKLNPQGTATRAQVATILQRMCQTWALLPQEDLSGLFEAINTTYQQHMHDYTYLSNQNFTHTGTCGCGQTVTEPCDYVVTAGTNEDTYTCTVCGDSYTVSKTGSMTAEPVARVGNKTFATLSEAIAAATDGATVSLMQNIEQEELVKVDGKKLTLELNGKKLTRTVKPTTVFVCNGAELTIQDSVGGGQIENTVTGGNAVQVNWGTDTDGSNAPSKLTLRSGKLVDRSPASEASGSAGVMVARNGVFVMEGGEIVSENGYAVAGNGAHNDGTDITISGGTLTSTNATALYHPQSGKLTITGGTFTGKDAALELRAGELNISGGSFEAKATTFGIHANGNGTTTTGAAIAIVQHTTKKAISASISGGTFEGIFAFREDDIENNKTNNVSLSLTGGTYNGMVQTNSDQNKNAKFITGGTFLGDPSDHVPAGYMVVENGVYHVVRQVTAENAVAIVGDNELYCATLQEAITYASSTGKTVKLNRDTTQSVSVSGTVTLDLNGHNITVADQSAIKVESGGVLTIQGSGTVSATGENTAALFNKVGGKTTLKSGTYVQNDACAIKNEGELTIEGGTVTGASPIANARPTTGSGKDGSMTISGGSFSGSNSLLALSGSGEDAANKQGSLTISGGTFTAPTLKKDYGEDANKKVWYPINITGGTFTFTSESETGFYQLSDTSYGVFSKKGLYVFADEVNTKGKSFKNETVKLMTDIDLNNEPWTPIGGDSKKFEGTFDGQNHTIRNLTINRASENNIGFFGFTTLGEIKNLTVQNATISGRLYVGVVAGCPYASKYTNIKVCGNVVVNGYGYVGGVVGYSAYRDLTNITVDVNAGSYVKADSESYRSYVGGVVGFMGEGNHKVLNVTSNIDVIGSTCDVGGIAGIAHYGNTFENVTCSGNVTLLNAKDEGDHLEIGGIAGVWMNSKSGTVTFKNCSFTGQLSTKLNGVDKTAELGPQHQITGDKYYKSTTDIDYVVINS